MTKQGWVGVVAGVILLGCAGCESVQKGTNVQKGAAVGGGSGAVLGAGIGQVTRFGGVPGALVGLGLGATAGAIAADQIYGSDQQGGTGLEEIEGLKSKMASRDAQVSDLRKALQREEAQKQALLEAHDKTRSELNELRARLGEDIQPSAEPGGAIKLTILSEVLFPSGKANLSARGKEVLAKAAETIRSQFPEAILEVRGHTDNVPIRYSSYASNWELACARALSVVHYLIEMEKFSPDRLMAVGLADTQPIGSNDTPEGRRANRRAEIIIRPNPQVAAHPLGAEK